MATITRPPFYAPRPADDTYWQGGAPRNSPIIAFLTKQKVFGAGGQAPTKRWLPYLTYDDPPMWQGAPLNSQAITVTRTQVKVFGQPGQAPTKRWLPYLTYDDAAYWSGAPVNSTIIAFLTKQKIFGAGGQVPPFRPNFTYDDPAFWQGRPIDAAPVALLTAQKLYGQGGQVPPARWNFNFDDPGFWQGAPRSAVSLGMPGIRFYGQIGQVPPYRWNYTIDDPPAWQATTQRNLGLLTQTQNPFSNRQWQWSDDASGWQGEPVSSAAIQLLTIQTLFGQGGQVVPFRPNFTLDDPPQWQGSPVASPIIEFLTQQKIFGAGGQVPPFRWNYTLDDAPPWQWPLYERNQNVLVPAGEPFNNYKTYWYAEDSFWQGAPAASAAIPLLTQQTIYGKGGQVPPFRPNATYDDPPMWQGGPLKASIIGLLTFGGTPFVNRWRYEYDDASGWQGQPVNAASLTLPVQQNPFSNRQTLWYAEDAWWSGKPVASAAIPLLTAQKLFGQGGQVPPFRPNFTLDDPPTWWPATERNLILLTTKIVFPSNLYSTLAWTNYYDDPPMWQGAPRPSLTITLPTPPPPTVFPTDWIDFYRRARRR